MDDQFKNTTYRILELFMFQPSKNFSIREIARQLKLSHATVLNHIDSLTKLDLIRKKNDSLYPTYYVNSENKRIKIYKTQAIRYILEDSGVIEHIKNKTLPSSIILFGSCAKGTFNEKSDIDLFVESAETKIDLKKYENKLKRSINILFEKKISNLSVELKNNIINGVILEGFIRI